VVKQFDVISWHPIYDVIPNHSFYGNYYFSILRSFKKSSKPRLPTASRENTGVQNCNGTLKRIATSTSQDVRIILRPTRGRRGWQRQICRWQSITRAGS
jgi:hypothetical protein